MFRRTESQKTQIVSAGLTTEVLWLYVCSNMLFNVLIHGPKAPGALGPMVQGPWGPYLIYLFVMFKEFV